MIRKVIYLSIALLAGIFLLSFPVFLNYLNQDTLPFDLAKFLNDYPAFRFIIGIILVILGFCGFIYLFFLNKYKTVFVIQESGDGDYGNPDLHYSLITKGESDEIKYTNLATLSNHTQDVILLEKKQIRLFYEKLPKEKKIAFLAVATIPSIVYAGFVVGENGRRVKYYHWDRKILKAKRIIGVRQSCSLFVEENIESSNESKDYVIYVSVSYLPNKEQAIKQFGNVNYVFCQSDNIGTDVVKTTKDLAEIANKVRSIISDIKVSGAKIHLILQCSAEVCFAIGQKLNTPALPAINVYSFNNKNQTTPWDWFVDIN